MIYTPKEYAKTFPINNSYVSESTIKRMIKKEILPSKCKIIKKSNRYLIEVK